MPLQTQDWRDRTRDDKRPPVFILVCKNTKLAKMLYHWIADDVRPVGISPSKLEGIRNRDGVIAAFTDKLSARRTLIALNAIHPERIAEIIRWWRSAYHR